MRSILVAASIAVAASVAIGSIANAAAEDQIDAAEIDRCQAQLQRALRKNRDFSDFRRAPDAIPREAKPQGKFTPRYPLDVDRILKLAGEALLAKKLDKGGKATRAVAADPAPSEAPPDVWIEAELWCGYRDGKLVAADMMARRPR